jgi:hypothetical protein
MHARSHGNDRMRMCLAGPPSLASSLGSLRPMCGTRTQATKPLCVWGAYLSCAGVLPVHCIRPAAPINHHGKAERPLQPFGRAPSTAMHGGTMRPHARQGASEHAGTSKRGLRVHGGRAHAHSPLLVAVLVLIPAAAHTQLGKLCHGTVSVSVHASRRLPSCPSAGAAGVHMHAWMDGYDAVQVCTWRCKWSA